MFVCVQIYILDFQWEAFFYLKHHDSVFAEVVCEMELEVKSIHKEPYHMQTHQAK